MSRRSRHMDKVLLSNSNNATVLPYCTACRAHECVQRSLFLHQHHQHHQHHQYFRHRVVRYWIKPFCVGWCADNRRWCQAAVVSCPNGCAHHKSNDMVLNMANNWNHRWVWWAMVVLCVNVRTFDLVRPIKSATEPCVCHPDVDCTANASLPPPIQHRLSAAMQILQ